MGYAEPTPESLHKAALLRRRLATGPLWLPADGWSMGAAIPWGSEVQVVAATRPRRGQVWMFCRSDGVLVVHRHRRTVRGAHVFQGDAKADADDPVGDGLLVGRVVAVRRNGGVRRLGTRDRVLSRSRRALRSGVVGVGPGAEATVEPDQGSGQLLPLHDRWTRVWDSVVGHAASSTAREIGDMVTEAAVLGTCSIDVAGIPARVGADGSAAAQALVALLGGARLVDAAPRVTVSVQSEPPAVPATAADVSAGGLEAWRPARGELVIRHERGMVARATPTTLVVGGDMRLRVAFRRVFLSALAHVIGQHGRQVVHGAAIAAGGRALIVIGPTGAGKSTLALSALRAGWDVLADDLVALRRVPDALYVAGIPRPMVVPADVLEELPVDPAPSAPSGAEDERRRCALPTEVVTPGWRLLAGCVVVGHAATPRGDLQPIDAHRVLRDVLGACAPIEGRHDLDRVLPVAASLARMPAVRLNLGHEPATRLDDCAASLADVRERFGFGP